MSDSWHRRHAVMLAAQLPENASDANAIIRELQNLVDTWLHPIALDQKANVLSIRREKD